MKLQDEYTFDADIEKVWDCILAGDALAAIIPGCEELTQAAPGEYEAVVMVNMFLFKSRLDVQIKIIERHDPDFCHFLGQAAGELGEMYVEGTFRLTEAGGKTRLKYEAQFEPHGTLGKMAERVIGKSGQEKIRESMRELEDKIKGAA